MEKMWLDFVLYFCVFFLLNLVELESSYKQYNKLYKSIKYPAMFFLYIISFLSTSTGWIAVYSSL